MVCLSSFIRRHPGITLYASGLVEMVASQLVLVAIGLDISCSASLHDCRLVDCTFPSSLPDSHGLDVRGVMLLCDLADVSLLLGHGPYSVVANLRVTRA